MKYKKTIFFLASIAFTFVHAQEPSKIISADENDYVDCAAFYMSVLSYLTLVGKASETEKASTKQRVDFFLKTAVIYSGEKSVTPDMQRRFLSKNNEYSSASHKMFTGTDKETYPNYVASRINECKDMLNINMKSLVEKQGIKTE